MDIFIQQIVNSLSVASVIILIGIGITIIFGLTGIINFAHGEFLMVGGMVTWALVSNGVNFFLALALSSLVVAILGFVLERGLFRFTLARPMNGFIVSLGLIVLLQHIVIRIWNSDQKSIVDPIGTIWQVVEVRIVVMRARRDDQSSSSPSPSSPSRAAAMAWRSAPASPTRRPQR